MLITTCGAPLARDFVDEVADKLIEESNIKRIQEAMGDTSIDKDLYFTVIEGGAQVDPVDDLISSCPRDGEPDAGVGPPWADIAQIEKAGPNEFWLTFNGELQSVLDDDISKVASLNISLIVPFPDGATVEYRKEWWGHREGDSEEYPPSSDPEAEQLYSTMYVFNDRETLQIKLCGDENLPQEIEMRVAMHFAEASGERPRSLDQVGE